MKTDDGTDIQRIAHLRDAVGFRKSLISWGRENFRSFPWRMTEDPYRILIAEVMLHRTRALQVMPVYERFIQRYADIAALVQASREELQDLLYPLGLRWITDLLYTMVAELVVRFDGEIPHKKTDLLALSGVSDYIASAVRCFAWNQPEPLIDTNTVLIVGRMFGLEIKDSSRRNRKFRELISVLVDPDEPRAYNYALLDLAAQVCTKESPPMCNYCPVSSSCLYSANSLLKCAACSWFN